jgi:hypothetical protein
MLNFFGITEGHCENISVGKVIMFRPEVAAVPGDVSPTPLNKKKGDNVEMDQTDRIWVC